MSAPPDSKRWINLEKVSALALEQSASSQVILYQMLRGLGIRHVFGASGLPAAQQLTTEKVLDVVIADPGFDGGRGLDFVRWLRHESGNDNRFVSIILLSGHSTRSAISLSRDSGANFVVAKPCSPKTMLERILWVARDNRPYVEVGKYAGPDRRFNTECPPDGFVGRRASDRSAASGNDEHLPEGVT